MKYLLTGRQMKQADCYAIQDYGMESLVLMERAALAVTEHILSGRKPGRVFLLCGMGNNGADGLAAARLLTQRGWHARVLAVGKLQKATSEWKYQRALLERMGIEVQVCTDSREVGADDYPPAQVYVDALFGVGLDREIIGIYAQAIDLWNSRRRLCGAYGVAVDICSGVDAADGAVLGTCIEADATVTFGYGKVGQFLYPGARASGRVEICDIGFPKEAAENISGNPLLCLEREEAAKWLPVRVPWGNKGTFGRVLVIAGSQGMAGAACLSAMAAYRTGAGLVELVTPSCNRSILQQLLPEAVLHCYPDYLEDAEDQGASCDERLRSWLEPICIRSQAIVIGPGLSQSEAAQQLLTSVLMLHGKIPLVIDADGLNLLAKLDQKELGDSVILTPHPGELARLLRAGTMSVKQDFRGSAGELLLRYRAVCVCKDARTVISVPDHGQYLNLTGNSGMAVGGSGDILTGVIAALAAQGLPPWRAAVLGVYLHGMAGDAAAEKKGQYGMVARDIIEGLPEALKQCSI